MNMIQVMTSMKTFEEVLKNRFKFGTYDEIKNIWLHTNLIIFLVGKNNMLSSSNYYTSYGDLYSQLLQDDYERHVEERHIVAYEPFSCKQFYRLLLYGNNMIVCTAVYTRTTERSKGGKKAEKHVGQH